MAGPGQCHCGLRTPNIPFGNLDSSSISDMILHGFKPIRSNTFWLSTNGIFFHGIFSLLYSFCSIWMDFEMKTRHLFSKPVIVMLSNKEHDTWIFVNNILIHSWVAKANTTVTHSSPWISAARKIAEGFRSHSWYTAARSYSPRSSQNRKYLRRQWKRCWCCRLRRDKLPY